MRNIWMVGAFLAVLLGVTPVKAATVTAGGTTVCSNYGSIDVGATGNVVINNCTSGGGSTGSTNAIFAVSAPANATVGTAVTATVTRTIGTGGTAGADTLTLASTLSAAFTPATVSFAASDTTKTVSVNFAAAGNAVLSVTGQGSGNTATPSAAITVSTGGSGACAGITPPAYVSEQPGQLVANSGIGGGTHNITASSSPDLKATGAFHFTVPSTAPASGLYRFFFIDSQGGNYGKDVGFSECPGDFTACVTTLGSGSDPFTAYTSSTPASCKLELGKTYYLNVRSALQSINMSFVLNVSP